MTTLDDAFLKNSPAMFEPAVFEPKWSDSDKVLADVAYISQTMLAPKAYEIDKGYYPVAEMAQLGAAGAFAAHMSSQGSRFDVAIDAMRSISRACGTTGFMTWAQDTCGLYLDLSNNKSASQQAVLKTHMSGETLGGTALSNPMKAWTDIEPMALKAKKVAGGYIISGSLPWVSNIGRGQYCGAVASIQDSSTPYDILFLLRLDERVELRQCPTFSGMEGSGTYGIGLNEYFVPNDDIIADPAKPFILKIRPVFILMQMGMGLGVIDGCIDDILSVENQLGHVNQFLQDQAGGLQTLVDGATKHTLKLAQTPFETSQDYLLDVINLRINAAKYCLRASEAALMHTGARGYLASAAPQRRVREAQFVAIVTPAIKHLRYLAQQLMTEEMPA
nr:acyl-CoA dehydrogenase family protein [Moraxella sp. CTOTU48717]